MKNIIRKILKEESDEWGWIQDNSISGEELRQLLLDTGATSIPFDRVSGDLDLVGTKIQSLGNLQSVGGYLYLDGTPMSKKYSKQEIRQMVQVNGNIYL